MLITKKKVLKNKKIFSFNYSRNCKISLFKKYLF